MTTDELFYKYQELQTLMAIADKVQNALIIPSEISDYELLGIANLACHAHSYRAALKDRMTQINAEIARRLEAQIK